VNVGREVEEGRKGSLEEDAKPDRECECEL
jgi:hypothetical protein